MSTRPPPAPSLPARVRTEHIFARVLPELLALPEEELLRTNMDVLTAVTTVLGCLPSVMALRPELERKCADFDIRWLERMVDYTWALRHAQILYLESSRLPLCSPERLKEALQLREALRSDIAALARRGLVDDARLRNVARVKGYRALASDLTMLTSILTDCWPALDGETALTQAEIQRARAVAEELLQVANATCKPSQAVEEACDLRRRAFTLFFRTYDIIRGAVTYVRWQSKDGSKIAPALMLGRKHKRRKNASLALERLIDPAQPAAHLLDKNPSVSSIRDLYGH